MKVFGEFLMTEKLGTYEPDKIYISEISIDIVESHNLIMTEMTGSEHE